MPKAEFGIIEEIDENTSFEYEPEQYHCTALEDEPYLDDWWGDLMLMKTFFHTLRRPAFGLARYGITIIPPCSLPQFQNIVLSDPRLKQNDWVSLEDPMREVMYLRLIGNLTFDQIGEIMGRSENWARVTYYRGKEKIVKEANADGTENTM